MRSIEWWGALRAGMAAFRTLGVVLPHSDNCRQVVFTLKTLWQDTRCTSEKIISKIPGRAATHWYSARADLRVSDLQTASNVEEGETCGAY